MAVDQSIAEAFPLASPNVYLDWAQTAHASGDDVGAKRALALGLRYFPEDAKPAGIPLASASDEYVRWIESAHPLPRFCGSGTDLLPVSWSVH